MIESKDFFKRNKAILTRAIDVIKAHPMEVFDAVDMLMRYMNDETAKVIKENPKLKERVERLIRASEEEKG